MGCKKQTSSATDRRSIKPELDYTTIVSLIQGNETVIQSSQTRFPHLLAVLEVLLLTDLQQTFFLDLIVQRFEAKLGTSGGQRLNNSEQTERMSDITSMPQENCCLAMMMRFTC